MSTRKCEEQELIIVCGRINANGGINEQIIVYNLFVFRLKRCTENTKNFPSKKLTRGQAVVFVPNDSEDNDLNVDCDFS